MYVTRTGLASDFKTHGATLHRSATGGDRLRDVRRRRLLPPGLNAPLNPNNEYWYDLSYLCFTMGGGGIG